MTSSQIHQSTVHVSTSGTPAAYDIHIRANILLDPTAYVAPHLPRRASVIVTDENVNAHIAPRFTDALNSAGIAHEKIILPAGEASKSFRQLEHVVSGLINFGIERTDSIIALGGGVIGDLTGFASAITRRGCGVIQVPTSLLAQVDSSVGGKTAINVADGKNLVGAFHQPSTVLIDICTLDSLPLRHRRAGLAEIIKYALIRDIDFFQWLEIHGTSILDNEPQALIHAITKSCQHKAEIVADDTLEQGQRALLNLGHTFGHALEAAFGYSDELLHGEAVALGMVYAFQYSVDHNLCTRDDLFQVQKILHKMGLPTKLTDLPGTPNLTPETLLQWMLQDKKVSQGKLTLILPHKIGDCRITRDIPTDTILDFWRKTLDT